MNAILDFAETIAARIGTLDRSDMIQMVYFFMSGASVERAADQIAKVRRVK